ncbi:hypothetical protein [Halegenticoccus tardaugens]|nr:hypothetical protein [Halegenticoccus tardaugens]
MNDAGTRTENEETDRDDGHLADLEDGLGCTEIWEQLSERRERAAAEADD